MIGWQCQQALTLAVPRGGCKDVSLQELPAVREGEKGSEHIAQVKGVGGILWLWLWLAGLYWAVELRCRTWL